MQPGFKNSLEIGVVASEGAILSGASEYVIHLGSVPTELYPLIDGSRDEQALAASISSEFSPQQIRQVLEELSSRNLLDWQPGLSEKMALDVESVLSPYRSQFDQPGKLKVIVLEDYWHDVSVELGRRAWHTGSPHLFIEPFGECPLIGPLVIPGKTACFDCLHHRLITNRPDRVFLASKAKYLKYYKPAVRELSVDALQFVSAELATWQDSETSQLVGRVARLDRQSEIQTMHTVIKRPQCPTCGEKGHIDTAGFISFSSAATFEKLSTGYRTQSANETLKAYQHLIDPLTGIIRRFERITAGAERDIHAYKVFHATRHENVDFHYLESNLYSTSGGKGKTPIEARASALCEAIERYCAVFDGTELTVSGSMEHFPGNPIHPNTCLLFSESQYETRIQWNANLPHYCQEVAEPFDSSVPIEWSPLWSFTEQSIKYLPTAYCYFSYDGPGAQFCRADSNGHAAGNTIEEALLQGFLELVERDAVAIWWYNMLRRPGVDLSSFDDPYIDNMLRTYQKIGRELWVLDLTTDLEIASFVAVSRSKRSPTEDIIFGFGAHLDPDIAVMRAITEINQVLPSAEAPESIYRHAARSKEASFFLRWLREARVSECPYLAPDPAIPLRTRDQYKTWEGRSLSDAFNYCVERAKSCNIEVLALNQTRPDINLPVVKVVAPGLRHYWKRLGKGRLYDVPVRLGWTDHKRQEAVLNPVPMSY